MTQGRAPISSGRYKPVIVNGQRQWMRDQVALQTEILSLLEAEGGLPKKRIITALSTAQAAVETGLEALLGAGRIERYKALSSRKRIDMFWCIAGRRPIKSADSYHGAAILAAFQHAAHSLYNGGTATS
ncbi:hypothetical protein [Paraburkholderia dilworthii]|uniref:Uncharacterized protein n=1 Tax=Paraburkholderia dilworthii TaxID=948106 RepID=A0ABW9D9I4_9BURK